MILRLSGKRYDHLRRCIHISRGLDNPYRILGLKAGASKKEVKSAYRDKVKTCHPGTINIRGFYLNIFLDLFPDDKSKEAEFRRIQEAYENILSGNITGNSDDSGPHTSQTRRSGFGPNSDFGPNVGFDFEQNYRARMKARAEWEKMAKKYKDAEREKYQKANRHYADWDNGGNDDGTQWHKDRSENYRTGPRTNRSSYAHEFRSEADERRYQQARAQRVQDNLHKSDRFRRHFDEEEINRINEAAFKRRQKYYEAASRKEDEDNAWRTQTPNQAAARIL